MQKRYLYFLTSITFVLSVTAQAQTTTPPTEPKRSFLLRIIPEPRPPRILPAKPDSRAIWSAPTNRTLGPVNRAALPTAYATAPTPAPAAQPPQDERINRVYLLNQDKVFFKFNHDTGLNEEISVPKGTRMRLLSIIETEASRNRKAYWNFVVVDSALSIFAQPVGAELWTIQKKIPKELVTSNSPNNRAAPNAALPRAAVPQAAPPPTTPSPRATVITPPPPPVKADVVTSEPVTPDIVVTAIRPARPSAINYEAEEKLDLNSAFSIKPGRVWAPACTNFLDERGNLGVWGRAIVQTLSTPAFAFMLDGTKFTDVRTMCPKFVDKNFGDEARKKFWVYFIASMAMSESSCNKGDTTPGPNGTLAGLLQLHLGRESAYGCSRATNARNAVANVTCGLTMLKNQVIRYGNLFVGVGKTYWEVLHSGTRGAAKVSNRVAAVRSCQQGVRSMSRR